MHFRRLERCLVKSMTINVKLTVVRSLVQLLWGQQHRAEKTEQRKNLIVSSFLCCEFADFVSKEQYCKCKKNYEKRERERAQHRKPCDTISCGEQNNVSFSIENFFSLSLKTIKTNSVWLKVHTLISICECSDIRFILFSSCLLLCLLNTYY